MKKVGYLLVEMLFALTMVTVLSGIIALLQSSLICWHKEAEQCLMATTIAQKAIAYMQTGYTCPIPKGFTVKTETMPINPQIPFTLYAARVSYVTPRGITKEITIVGGQLHATT